MELLALMHHMTLALDSKPPQGLENSYAVDYNVLQYVRPKCLTPEEREELRSKVGAGLLFG